MIASYWNNGVECTAVYGLDGKVYIIMFDGGSWSVWSVAGTPVWHGGFK